MALGACGPLLGIEVLSRSDGAQGGDGGPDASSSSSSSGADVALVDADASDASDAAPDGAGSDGATNAPITALVGGYGWICALRGTKIACWGRDDGGAVTGTINASIPMPTSYALPATTTTVYGGTYSLCALQSDARLTCSGSIGQHVDYASMQTAASGVGAAALSSTNACVRDATGSVRCVGDNGSGQIAGSANGWETALVTVRNDDAGVVKVFVADSLTCVATSTRTQCFGSRSSTSLDIINDAVSDLAVGATHYCYVRGSDSAVMCAGADNSYGQLGDGSTAPHTTPTRVTLEAAARSVVSGDGFSCAVLTNGAVWCWGSINTFVNVAGNALSPVKIPSLPAVTMLSIGDSACAASVGDVYCWGLSSTGRLGGAMSRYVPTRITLPP